MKNYIKIAVFSIIAFVIASCACGRTDDKPLTYELQEDVVVTLTDSTEVTITEGCLVYVYEDDDFLNYNLLKCKDMLDDNDNYREVIVRMGKINDSTEVKGFMSIGALMKQKKLR